MSNWRKVRVAEIAAEDGLVGGPFGSSLGTRDYVPNGVPVIRGSNLAGPSRFGLSNLVFVSEEKAEELRRNIALPGDLVFTQRGTLGQVGVVPDGPFGRYVISQSQMRLRVNPAVADRDFVYYVFRSREMKETIEGYAVAAGVPHINLDTLGRLTVRLPSLEEQRVIARVLSVLDDKIELNRQMNRTLEAMAQAIFRSWFVDFDPVVARAARRRPFGMDDQTVALFPDRFVDSELGPIPGGWKVSSIGQEVRVVGGSTPRTDEPRFWKGGTIHWLTPRDLSKLTDPVVFETERRITDDGLAQISSGLLPRGTVLLSSRAPIGYLAIAEVPLAVNQGFIAMLCEGALPTHYILHWTRENMGEILTRAGGTTFAEISKASFRPIPVLVPSAPVLTALDSLLPPMYERIVVNVRESHTLAELRNTLLPKLLSGEIRVTQAERVVGGVI